MGEREPIGQGSDDELAACRRELDEFSSAVSHDLQQPLTAITGYLDLLERRYEGRLGDDADEFIRYAEEGAARLQEMIGDLLAYSRVTTRGEPIRLSDSGRALGEALSSLSLVIQHTGAQVAHGPLPEVMADDRQLVELLRHLVDNAIKFRGEAPPRVSVSAQRRKSQWCFSVRDNGIGIEPKDQVRIFTVFGRLHAVGEYPGTGMGLAVAKKIVERHGGRIWVESEPGKGSSFLFTLPARRRGGGGRHR